MMTSPPSTPNRRWQRIVITIAVLLLGVGWWYWTRGDSRFVGKWAVLIDDAAGVPQPDGEVVIHRSNGRTTQFINGVEQPRQFHWWVDANDFVIEPNWPTGFEEVQEFARGLYGKLTGNPIDRQQIRFPIADCSESEIVFRSPRDSSEPVRRILLRRLPE